jgi:hypothetical protein
MDMQIRDALEETPYKSYTKTITASVYVVLWNEVERKEETRILKGKAKTETAVVNVYSKQEDLFFRRKNNRHFVKGNIIEFTPVIVEEVRTFEQSTDEELKDLLNASYKKLEHQLNATSSVAVLNRLKNLAEEIEKSPKILDKISTRIAEVQGFSED